MVERYAEMDNLKGWTEWFDDAEWVAEDDIKSAFFRVPMKPRRAAMNGFRVFGMTFVLMTGAMGSRDAPRGFVRLLAGALRGLACKYPDI